MADISTIARRYRAALIAREDQAVARMRRDWRRVQRTIDREIQAVEARLIQLRAQGIPPEDMRATLDREQRLTQLRALVAAEARRFTPPAMDIAAAHAQAAATIAPNDARAMIAWGTPAEITLDTIRLPVAAVEQISGATRSPQFQALFAGALDEAGRSIAATVADELVVGLARGENPRRVASRMRAAVRGAGVDPLPLSRARTIARTEAMRAYRDAAIATYSQNLEVVKGWTWVAALDRRTCGSCIAQHGSEHPLDEEMATHPSCRCVAAPLVRTWRELGFPSVDEPAPVEPGAAWFRRQPESVQLAVLGPSKLAAVRARRIALTDLIERSRSPAWGPSTREGSLAAARANAARRRQTAARAA